MVNRPSVPEIITVNSEELQTQIRDLLPSQNGFGSELQATNIITPIIDLTAAAEGSQLRSDLQTAVAFGSQTAFDGTGSTVTVANSPGFYRLFGVSTLNATGLTNIKLSDGSTNKTIWQHQQTAAGNTSIEFDFVVWLAVGESVTVASNNSDSTIFGSSRQIANSQGEFVPPNGYPL